MTADEAASILRTMTAAEALRRRQFIFMGSVAAAAAIALLAAVAWDLLTPLFQKRIKGRVIAGGGIPLMWYDAQNLILDDGGAMFKLNIAEGRRTPFFPGQRIDSDPPVSPQILRMSCFAEETLVISEDAASKSPRTRSVVTISWDGGKERLSRKEAPVEGRPFVGPYCIDPKEDDEFPPTVSVGDNVWERHENGSLTAAKDGPLIPYVYPTTDAKVLLLHRDRKEEHQLYAVDHRRIGPDGWLDLGSVYDAAARKYLLYSGLSMSPGSGPFNAWWYDPNTEALDPFLIPEGGWVESDSPLRTLSFFGRTDSFRGYQYLAGAGRIYLWISGSPKALSPQRQGFYALNAAGTVWTKIANESPSDQVFGGINDGYQAPRGIPLLSPDGCVIARRIMGGVELLPVCAGR